VTLNSNLIEHQNVFWFRLCSVAFRRKKIMKEWSLVKSWTYSKKTFLQGAYSLILLHEYALTKDFDKVKDTVFSTIMYAITSENIQQFKRLDSKMTLESIKKKLTSVNILWFLI